MHTTGFQPPQMYPPNRSMAPSLQGSAPPDPQALNLYTSYRSMTMSCMPPGQTSMHMYPNLMSALHQTTATPASVPITANTGFPYSYYPNQGAQAASPVYPSYPSPAYPSYTSQQRMM